MLKQESSHCEKCDGTGFIDYRGFSMTVCMWCAQGATIEKGSIVAIATPTVKKSLTVHERVSEAITLLYTYEIMTERERDNARTKLTNL